MINTTPQLISWLCTPIHLITKRDREYTVIEQATLQEAFLEYLGITKVHILAHDLGDTVALEMLARYG